jgi:hypothetical protein
MQFNFARKPSYDAQSDWIDAGLVAPQEEFRITFDDWLLVSPEDLDSLSKLPLYANQQYRVEKDLRTGDTLVHVRYSTPTITTLEEKK